MKEKAMKLVKNATARECCSFEDVAVVPEVTEEDLARFDAVVSTDLADWQVEQVVAPAEVHARQETVLAVHWHPEFVPMELIRRRIEATFPRKKTELLIPTQHNELVSYDGYTGVEVDCFSSGFNRKVQLLLHFANDRLKDAGVLRCMLNHTFQYRSSQLFDFIHTITRPVEKRINAAARETGADGDLIEFVRANVAKIETLLDEHWERVPPASVKNKLLRNWFDAMRPELGDVATHRVQAYLKAVKQRVKAEFSLEFFYRASEFIEETHRLGGCVVIPHPEQFWPILLRNYDVDGIEVWNPQSQEYTEFLIQVVNERNARRPGQDRKTLIFMGDDCHMGEKTKPQDQQDTEKAGREIGVQPPWDDMAIRKLLIVNSINRRSVIKEYRARLDG
jgi:hypothetical protein